MFIDTHAHLNFKAYDNDRDEVIKRALGNGIRIINVGVDWGTSQESVELAEKYPEGIFAAVGLHPNSVDEFVDSRNSYLRIGQSERSEREEFDYEEYKELARNEKVAAIGETGLDYFRIKNRELRIKQKEVFKKQIELAIELNKPLIIHCRDAHDDVLEILKSYTLNLKSNLKGAIHSFSGNLKQAEQYQKLGFKIAFNGIITFSRDYDEVILKTPLENILIETDCPFLAPVPYRGQRNEPSYIGEIAKKLAEIKNVELGKVIEQTTKNAEEVFNILD
jgi:TatD DNase family protein